MSDDSALYFQTHAYMYKYVFSLYLSLYAHFEKQLYNGMGASIYQSI